MARRELAIAKVLNFSRIRLTNNVFLHFAIKIDQELKENLILGIFTQAKQDLHIKNANPVRIGTGFLKRFVLSVRVDKLQVIRLPYFSPYTSVIHQADH